MIWLTASDAAFATLVEGDSGLFSAAAALIAWTTLTAINLLLGVLAYRGLTGAQFHAAVLADPGWRARQRTGWRTVLRASMVGDGPSSMSTSTSVLTLVVVIGLNVQPTLRAIPVLLVVGLILVALSWLSVAMTYSTHYARLNATGTAFAFPGEPASTFSDYLYVGLSVQAAISTGDVSVTSRSARRAVSSHAVLAFAFNTVILGMIVSLLLRML